MAVIRIQPDDFDVAAEYDRLRHGAGRSGAIVTFTGLVRDFNSGDDNASVQTLTLQHYPGMTEKLLGDIVTEAQQRWQIDDVTVIHRVGTLRPGDQIVLVAVASGHRREAFEAAEFLMDYLKTRATLWKKVGTGESEQWLAMKDSDRRAAERWRKPESDK